MANSKVSGSSLGETESISAFLSPGISRGRGGEVGRWRLAFSPRCAALDECEHVASREIF